MSESPIQAIFFYGEFDKQLDDKRRLTVPAKWRFKGDDADNSYLAVPNGYGSITVLSPDKVSSLYEKISKIKITDATKRRAVTKFLSSADRFGCDKQGRIVISEKLVKYAGIENGETKLIGAGDTFEIWNPERRTEYDKNAGEEEIATLSELDI